MVDWLEKCKSIRDKAEWIGAQTIGNVGETQKCSMHRESISLECNYLNI